MDGGRLLGILAVIVAGALGAGCSGSASPPSTSSDTETPGTIAGPTVVVESPTPSPTWTFITNQKRCPIAGSYGTDKWVGLPMETTVPEEAEIGTEVGMCASETGDRTFLINLGETAWSINTTAAVTHYYYPDAPALLEPLREDGVALQVLGPHEAALIAADPRTLSWDVDVPMTMTASTVGEMADQYAANDFTLDALKRWKANATQKGSPNKVLAACANSAYRIAQEQWTSMSDVSSVVNDITAGLATGRSATSCLSAMTEFDAVQRVKLGQEPRVSLYLQSRTFEVTGKRLSYAEKAAKLLGAALKAAR